MARHGDQFAVARLAAMPALHKFGVARRAAPVALDAGAGVAQLHFLEFGLAGGVFAGGRHEGLSLNGLELGGGMALYARAKQMVGICIKMQTGAYLVSA